MADKVIAKTDLAKWIKELASKFTVIAPEADEQGHARWKEAAPDKEFDYTAGRNAMAAKEFLLPAYELLFRYKKDSLEEILPEDEKTVIMMGLTLCDAHAIQVLDSVYLDGKFKDPYYAARREKLALVASVCDKPRWSCFCTSVGDLEQWAKDVDVLITDIGDSIYVQPVSELGEKIVEGEFFRTPTEEETTKKEDIWQRQLALPKRLFAGRDIYKMVDWDDAIWTEIAKKCVGCGACSYLCPSCSCFDIQDEVCGDVVERFRCRDTCQFTDFTLMGAGHNPRPEKTMRVRQRIMHKFKYQIEQFGMLGCTGCGRCVEACPVNIDLREVLTEIAEREKVEAGQN